MKRDCLFIFIDGRYIWYAVILSYNRYLHEKSPAELAKYSILVLLDCSKTFGVRSASSLASRFTFYARFRVEEKS